MNMLHHCGTLDSVAASYERRLTPLYDTLCSVAPALGELGVVIPVGKNDGTTTNGTAVILRQPCESGTLLGKVQDVTGQLVDLLRNPFGHRMYGRSVRGTMYGTETWNESERGALGIAMDTGEMNGVGGLRFEQVETPTPLPTIVEMSRSDIRRTSL